MHLSKGDATQSLDVIFVLPTEAAFGNHKKIYEVIGYKFIRRKII